MKFPISVLNKDEYLGKISNLLDDEDCIIFLDTNIFALFFRIYSTARSEFFNWAKPLIDKGRIKTPVWAVNEYTNRFIRKQTADYFGPLKTINKIAKEFEEVKNFLKMNFDPTKLYETSFSDRESYFNDLDLMATKLKKLNSKSKSQDQIIEIHDEIHSTFDSTILSSDIFMLLQEINMQGDIRYKHKLPPGFKDDIKELNYFGDLIIWLEIIEYCKRNNTKKVILLTNDNKTDWLFAPYKIIENSRKIPNNDPEFKIADTRLVFEFELATGSEELYIINFETLTNILISKDGRNFFELAKALQLANLEENPQNSEFVSDSNSENFEFENVSENVTETISSELSDKFYTQQAFADSTFQLNEASELSSIIYQLKSHNWYSQNNAIEILLQLSNNPIFTIKKDISEQYFINALFVIGRNIYQSACGGSFLAIEFMRNLKGKLAFFPNDIAFHIVNGMFYEVYFNFNGEFRNSLFKTSFISELFILQTDPQFKPSIDFIKKELQIYHKCLLLFPAEEFVILTFNIISKEENKGIVGEVNMIQSITVDEKEILVDTDEVFFGNRHFWGYEENLVDKLVSIFAIPKEQIKLNFIPKNEIKYFETPSGKAISLNQLTIESEFGS